MADLDFFAARVAEAVIDASAEHRNDAVALDRFRIGAWLRKSGLLLIARAIETGEHISGDQPPIPSLRGTMAELSSVRREREDLGMRLVRRTRAFCRLQYLVDTGNVQDVDTVLADMWRKSDERAGLVELLGLEPVIEAERW